MDLSNDSGDTRNALREHFGFLRQTLSAPIAPGRRAEHEQSIITVSVELVGSFPAPGDLWSEHKMRVELVEQTLEIIALSAGQVDAVYAGRSDVVRLISTHLLCLCNTLEQWIAHGVAEDISSTSPAQLRAKAVDAAARFLRAFGGSASTGEEKPHYMVLRSILKEWLDCCHDLVSNTSTLNFPVQLHFFEPSRLKEVPKTTNFPDKGLTLGEPLTMLIPVVSTVPLVLALLLEVICRILSPTLLSQWFLLDVLRLAHTTTRTAFDFTHACVTTGRRRMRALVIVTAANTDLLVVNPGGADLRFRLLRIKMEGREWSDEDATVRQSMERTSVTSSVKANVQVLLGLFATVGLDRCAIGSVYFKQCIPHLDESTLQAARVVLSDRIKEARQAKHPSLVDLKDVRSKLSPQVAPANDIVWKSAIRALVGDIVAPEPITWMDVESEEPHEYAQRALDEIGGRFTRPLADASTSGRLELSGKLHSLSTLLASHKGEKLDIATLPALCTATAKLLQGSPQDVSLAVKRSVYNMFGQGATCHAPDIMDGQSEAGALALEGLEDSERSVRICAGRLQSHLIQIYPYASAVFKSISDLIDGSKTPIQETAVVCLGAMGRTDSASVLKIAVCLLVHQLASMNPIVKGAAYMQLLDLARYHKKSQYSLISPYLDRLAFHILSSFISNPGYILECRRFMNRTKTEFLNITVDRALPSLFGQRDRKVLEQLAKEQGKMSASSLYIGACLPILTHAFMLPTEQETMDVLDFIIQILTNTASGNAKIDAFTLAKSEVVALLATLIIETGADHLAGQTQALAHQALVKVVNVMSMRDDVVPTVGEFLEGHMLGVISHITDTLHDAHGKKTIEAKAQCIVSLQSFVKLIGPKVTDIGPQVMATLQNAIVIPELSEPALKTWRDFLKVLEPTHLGAHVGPTSATIVALWNTFPPKGQARATSIMEYIMDTLDGDDLDAVVDFSGIPTLAEGKTYETWSNQRAEWTSHRVVEAIITRSSSENVTVAAQSLLELKAYMTSSVGRTFIRNLATGDLFDPLVSDLMNALVVTACREEDESDDLRALAFECIGILGAVDPDRSDFHFTDDRVTQIGDFGDLVEAHAFALYFIKNVLVGAYRSASDTKHQSHLAFAIQELLKFCGFTLSLAQPGVSPPPSKKIIAVWRDLPEDVRVACTPLLDARYKLGTWHSEEVAHPVYPTQSTYREWIQRWTTDLISKAAPGTAHSIFGVFLSAVRNKDVGVAHYLLPHLVLHVLLSGPGNSFGEIQDEIICVMEDQLDSNSTSSPDKKLLSAQVVFMLLDHLNTALRLLRQKLVGNEGVQSRRGPLSNVVIQERITRIDGLLSNLNQDLMAKAALQCKSYARALMSFERHLFDVRERNVSGVETSVYYERLHEIYAHLDEPDGMAGVSTLIQTPSLEHQIRQHESTGHWTSAQSCWEIRLQESPDNLDFHLGLLRCLRNVGHYDTLRTHVKGVLTRNPEWAVSLADFHVESAWMVGAWDDVENIVSTNKAPTSSMAIARVILAMRSGSEMQTQQALRSARLVLGVPIIACGTTGYRRCYEAVLNLHITYDLEMIHGTLSQYAGTSRTELLDVVKTLKRTLSTRLEATLPTFRHREPVLSMLRTAYSLITAPGATRVATKQAIGIAKKQIGESWLASAKIARKANQSQTAYSAMLHAGHKKVPWEFFERVKLLKSDGKSQMALRELENSMRVMGILEENSSTNLPEDKRLTPQFQGKAHILRARWMNDSGRYETKEILSTFNKAIEVLPKWESAYYYLGRYYDDSFKELSSRDQEARGRLMKTQVAKQFALAIKFGSKFVYQTVPRLLTIWLDWSDPGSIKSINQTVTTAIKETPVYKWYTAFPQIVSRVGHENESVYNVLAKLISTVITVYPQQALWIFAAVVKSRNSIRASRGSILLDGLKNRPGSNTQLPTYIDYTVKMTDGLLALCSYEPASGVMRMEPHVPKLFALGNCPLIIPVQESLIANLPPSSDDGESPDHQPFPDRLPTFNGFLDRFEIMNSLAKPRKIGVTGSDGILYNFLGKPKDDLRKDARLMEFNGIINKLLKANPESRRRQLLIRTYGVVPLNEECGFIQWVDHTLPLRPALTEFYNPKGVPRYATKDNYFAPLMDTKGQTDAWALEIWKEVLRKVPPVFRFWFINTFPEPTAWLAARLNYSHTLAVMSMVGFILGLGDRHTENILIDDHTGEVVHVDLNMLFEKGKTLDIPETVPFRLTQNLVDGLGITGYEGTFRLSCEITLQLLRDNAASLMSVLDAFVHDPLGEWADEQRRLDLEDRKNEKLQKAQRGRPPLPAKGKGENVPARKALGLIEQKLKGVFTTSVLRPAKETSTPNLVEMLIHDATDHVKLCKMYSGWTAWQ